MAFFIFQLGLTTMDQQTLHLFCQQLAHWADAAIDSGRFPFRRAEPFFPLLTNRGEISPPLILWINRDSFMAGGLLFLSSAATEMENAVRIACADARGLKHFVVWAPREVAIWETCGNTASPCKSLPLTRAETTSADFCQTFLVLLEELKQLAILSALPPSALSAFYLANLCRLARQSTMPSFAEAFRVAWAENADSARLSPSSAPVQQSYLLLLRLLALLVEDRLPPAIRPEGLDRALLFALDTLPAEIRSPLEIQPWELPLPSVAAVRLHHLDRRLTQLQLATDRPRCQRTLEILLADGIGELGGALPPTLPPTKEATAGSLYLYPDRCYPASAVCAEVGSAPLLAFTALLRRLQGEPPVRIQSADLLTLGKTPSCTNVCGTLFVSRPLTPSERRTLAARLRLSWPNRRFPLPPQSPRWIYELVHLLGLTGNGACLALNTPDWLKAPFGDFIFGLFRQDFALLSLERSTDGLKVYLQKGESVEETVFTRPEQNRQIPWARLKNESASFLRLTLDLPDQAFTLLAGGALHIPEDGLESSGHGLFLFSRSSLGRLLWHMVSDGLPLPSRQTLAKKFTDYQVPLPPLAILHQLEALFTSEQAPAQKTLDRELSLWLGVEMDFADMATPARPRTTRRSACAKDEVAEKIRHSVLVDGLPQFPERYLYDHYRPQLVEYHLSGPLEAGEEFIGQYTLHDGQGRTLAVEGRETARALLLASFSGRSVVSLPADQHLTESLLERYLQDLRDLHLALVRESHRYLHNSRTADALVEEIWSDLPLPPWKLVTN